MRRRMHVRSEGRTEGQLAHSTSKVSSTTQTHTPSLTSPHPRRRWHGAQVEPRPLRESIDYVDIDLGSWEQEDSEIEGLNMPSDIARSGSIVTGLHGFFDRVRTCRPVKLQRIHVGASYMWTCRRGPYWNAEAAVTVGDGWRVRLVAVYEDQRTEEGQPVAQLRSIISILERKGEFPPDMLDSLPFPFSLQASSQAVQDVPALGQWLGLAETVSEQPEETCPATGAESHMMVEWEGFTRMRDDTVQGGGWDGEYVACMENNSVFMLPGGAVLAAPRTIGLETEAQEGCKQVAVSMTWQVGSGLSVPKVPPIPQPVCLLLSLLLVPLCLSREGERAGGREGEREGGRAGGREGGSLLNNTNA
jgi:hypothetical protein